MNKCHVPITWVNDQAPAINDTHLNQYDGELDTLDDRVITLDTTKANQSDLLTAMADWDVDNATGDVTITLKSGQTITRHTNLGKIAINVRVIHDPTDPHYQEMEITMPDGTKDYVDFSAFVTQFEFVDSSEIHASVNSDGEVSFSLINGSITGAKLQPNYLADVTAQANIASGAATTATNKATLAESYAVGGTGTRAGEDTDNAKYYKEQAQAIAAQTLGGLTDVTISSPQNGQALVYDGNSGEWVNKTVSSSRTPDNITSRLSDLPTAISEQNLEKFGYKIGDYFERTDGARTYTYLLADLNHLKGTDTPYCIPTNHIAIVVDTNEKISWGSSTSGGYAGSNLHSYLSGIVLNNIKSDMIALFGGTTGLEHLLSNSKLYSTSSGGSWGWSVDQYITALTESNVVGHMEFSRTDGFQEGEEPRFLEVFSKWKWTEFYSKDFWLRNISSNSPNVCLAGSVGLMGIKSPTDTNTYAVGLISFY